MKFYLTIYYGLTINSYPLFFENLLNLDYLYRSAKTHPSSIHLYKYNMTYRIPYLSIVNNTGNTAKLFQKYIKKNKSLFLLVQKMTI